jgi:hypothetical protein
MAFHRRATAFSAWNAVRGLFLNNASQRAVYALQDFHCLQQGDLSVHDYCCRLKRLADTLTNVGHPITDQDLVVNTMCGLSNKFTNALGVINAMNPLSSFLWVHSYLVQEETRLDRSHKMETANMLLAAGGSTGDSSSAAAALVATGHSTGASKPPVQPAVSSQSKGGDRKKKRKNNDGALASTPDPTRQIRRRSNKLGCRLPGPAWSRPGKSPLQTGVLRPLEHPTPGLRLHLTPCSPRHRRSSSTPSERRRTSTPRSMDNQPLPRLTPAAATGSLTLALLLT